jgi:hypothetical protein
MSFRQKINGPMCFVEFEDVPFAAQAIKDLYGNNLVRLVFPSCIARPVGRRCCAHDPLRNHADRLGRLGQGWNSTVIFEELPRPAWKRASYGHQHVALWRHCAYRRARWHVLPLHGCCPHWQCQHGASICQPEQLELWPPAEHFVARDQPACGASWSSWPASSPAICADSYAWRFASKRRGSRIRHRSVGLVAYRPAFQRVAAYRDITPFALLWKQSLGRHQRQRRWKRRGHVVHDDSLRFEL